MPQGLRLAFMGTDTGVGKTWVASALARSLSAAGVRVGVFKPFESGCPERDGALVPADAERLRSASGARHPLEAVCPWAFPRAVAPAVELERIGRDVSAEQFVAACQFAATETDVLLIELAGGVRTPLTGALTSLDIVAWLGAVPLLVTDDRLGTLTRTRTAIEAARGSGIRVDTIFLNAGVAAPDASRDSNERWIRRMNPDQRLVRVDAGQEELRSEAEHWIPLLRS